MRIFISAGEESGEVYGAGIMREMKKIHPDIQFVGIGGDRMQAEGLEVLHHIKEMAAIGIVDILKKYFFFRSVLKEIKAKLNKEEFDAVILIDAPELNFRIGRPADEAGIPVFYYVCPQIWAWRTHRVNIVRQWVDTMLVIFPFEEKFYLDKDVKAKFVGHPLLDEIEIHPPREKLRDELLPENKNELIGLMPGSRNAEIDYILKPQLEIADIIQNERAGSFFVIPVAGSISMERVKAVVGSRDYIKVLDKRSHDVMSACDLLITKSGTSTLEAAILGSPMIIVYSGSPISYWLARSLAVVEFAGLPNLVAGREVATEYLQGNFKPERVAKEALELLSNPLELKKKRDEMKKIRESLGNKGATKRASEYIMNRLKNLTKEKA